IQELVRRLSMSSRQVDVSEELNRAVDNYAARMPSIGLDLAVRSPYEVYRVFLVNVSHRLRLALQDPTNTNAYARSQAFAADLALASNSLSSNGGRRLANRILGPLSRQVETFGFHLHTLDVRQHAGVHARAVAELLGEVQDFQKEPSGEDAGSPSGRARLAGKERSTGYRTGPGGSLSKETADLLATLREIGELKRDYPAQAIRSYVITG